MAQAAAGFRVKSGWATAVLLAGPTTAPSVVTRGVVQLADPRVPESSQPYHEALDLPKEEGAKVVARLVEIVERFASRSLGELMERYAAGHPLVGAGIVVGSDVDPQTIGNEHIRAHAEEGRLFRRVIEEAAGRHGLPSWVIVEKRLFATAGSVVGRAERQLKEDLVALGRGIGGPWRAEEKAATLAAWMGLFQVPPPAMARTRGVSKRPG